MKGGRTVLQPGGEALRESSVAASSTTSSSCSGGSEGGTRLGSDQAMQYVKARLPVTAFAGVAAEAGRAPFRASTISPAPSGPTTTEAAV